MHPVENGEGHGQVDHNYPGFKAKDNFLQSVVILRAAAKGRGDPKLKEKRWPSVTISPWTVPREATLDCGFIGDVSKVQVFKAWSLADRLLKVN